MWCLETRISDDLIVLGYWLDSMILNVYFQTEQFCDYVKIY